VKTWQVNTREDYDVVEAEEMEVDSAGNLTAFIDGVPVAGWAPTFWYGYKCAEVDDEERQDELS
jgi:hypothetical protein